MRRRRAWVFIDTLAAMVLMSLLMVMLSIAIGSFKKADARLADVRNASQLAEEALTCLQAGSPLPPPLARKIEIERIDEPAPRMQAPATRRTSSWARVTARSNGRSASLVGLIPTSALKEGSLP